MIAFIAPHAPLIGLLICFSFFTGTAIWLMLPNTKKSMRKNAMIPLMENDHDRA